MLKYRILTALCLIPFTLILLFFAPSSVLYVVMLLVLLGASIEWRTLIPTEDKTTTIAFIFAVFLSLSFCAHYFMVYQYLGFLTWAGLFLALLQFPKGIAYWGGKTLIASFAFILLPLCIHSLSLTYLERQGPYLLLYLLFLVWAADTGAYFSGKWLGKHKLAPDLSPGKTIEGLIGGACSLFIISLLGLTYFAPPSPTLWFTQAIGTLFFALIGDLFMSMLKRRVKCKDTGQLLPGHGGILDRLDSLIAAAPIFYLLKQPY